MKARVLQFATVLLIGIALAGCAGTGAKDAFLSDRDQALAEGPWPSPGRYSSD